MTIPNDAEPLQWAVPASLEIPADPLQLRLDFYGETIIMFRMEEGVVNSRPVAAVDIAAAMSRDMTFSSGLLPPAALWWSRGRDGDRVALWRKPQLTRVAVQVEAFKAPERYHIPMPGLVFLCQSRRAPLVYAARRRPTQPEDQLFFCPTFNVFRGGMVCPGTHDFPAEVEKIPESFFQSLFSLTGDSAGRSQKHPRSMMALWKDLDGTKRYPMDDLMPCTTVGRVQDGRGL